MKNIVLETEKNRVMKELGDYLSCLATAESIITDLASEIESIEQDVDSLRDEMTDKLDDANSTILDLQYDIKLLEQKLKNAGVE